MPDWCAVRAHVRDVAMQALGEPYLAGSSRVHRLDPRLKLLAATAYIVVVSALPAGAWRSLAALALLLGSAVWLSGVPWLRLLRRTAVALPFVALIALSVPFVRGGEPVWTLHLGSLALSATDEGLLALGAILAKAWLAMAMSALLIATTPLAALFQALQLLRLPPILCSTLMLMIRYLFVLAEEALRLQAARAARSAGGGRSVFWRAQVLGHMIGSLLIRSIARAERIYLAMLSRGYDGARQQLPTLTWRSGDTFAALAWGAALASAAALALL